MTVTGTQRVLDLRRTLIMGVLNVTPDSFADGGRFFTLDQAVEQAHRMAAEGADVIDVGGESSRPGSDPISEQEELRRVGPVIERLAAEIDVPLSIDSYRPAVAAACLRLGARMINDITGLKDPEMLRVACRQQAAVVIMHMKGVPKTMQLDVAYRDVVAEVKDFLERQARRAREAGLEEIIIDPGIGFGKTAEHNFEILKRLAEFESIGCPIMIGPSRKSFLAGPQGLAPDERLEGTLAAVCAGVMNGAKIVRVHDVKESKRAVEVVDAIRSA